MPETFSVRIAGPAGSGIMSAGEILFRSFVKAGYYALGYPEYPSLIKGGHNSYLITVSDKPFPNNSPNTDLLLALTQTALDHEHTNIEENTHIIVDTTIKADHEHKRLYQPALLDVAKNAGNALTLNTAMLGFATHQLTIAPEIVWQFIAEELGQKNQTILDQNKTAFDAAQKLSLQYHLDLSLPKQTNKDHRLCLTGSQAVGLGAIAAGINLYAGYPMTPTTTLLHFMAAHQEEFNYIVRQTEDETCAINLIVGASFAGAKAMTGTAGGGFALMTEGLSLAGMLETPIVIYVGQRPGPATGLPTWTSQGDLLFAINAGHGEFAKIVLAPADPLECYSLTHQAFFLSQSFHCPVIILSDKYLAENMYSLPDLPSLNPVALSIESPQPSASEMYPRFAFTPDGIHPRTLPGMPGGEYVANSDEHDSHGLDDETAANRLSNNQCRLHKIAKIRANIPLPQVIGKGDKALISFGSHKHIAAHVAKELKLTHIHFSYLWPLPDGLSEMLSSFKHIITVENNETHQLSRLLHQETGIKIDLGLGEDSGRPLNPYKLIDQITNA